MKLRISQLVYMIETKFQRLHPCFRGHINEVIFYVFRLCGEINSIESYMLDYIELEIPCMAQTLHALNKVYFSIPYQFNLKTHRITILGSHQVCQAENRGIVGSTHAFGTIGHGFESEHRLFSHHIASAFSKLRSLAKCSLDDLVQRLL